MAMAHGKEPSERVVRAERKPSTGPSEHQMQCALVQWWRYECVKYKLPENALFAVPSGGMRDQIIGARLKAEGVRRGIPDLLLLVPRGQFHGLALELKIPGGRISPEQKDVMWFLSSQNYRAMACFGLDSAIAELKSYLEA